MSIASFALGFHSSFLEHCSLRTVFGDVKNIQSTLVVPFGIFVVVVPSFLYTLLQKPKSKAAAIHDGVISSRVLGVDGTPGHLPIHTYYRSASRRNPSRAKQ